MGDLLDAAPIAAAAFAIPQFLPQLRKLRATDDTAGVSWPWATLTSVNNARVVRALTRIPVLPYLPLRLAAFGLRPEHVRLSPPEGPSGQ
jgi:hypothetical protein